MIGLNFKIAKLGARMALTRPNLANNLPDWALTRPDISIT